ncbi:Pyranose dehydrogenase 1 [Colletotrichum higginsianum]|uniref:Pyranose dehydrogenase 1 n=1 Tax=Colletotrichum higginsianum TaxID=80884 RepID=A0A4T0VV29_9PEZI|nr:Pyranose dehydrogenase 1 [Colletotrichum higginsianum]
MSKTSPLLAVAAALALSTVGTSALSVLGSIAHTKILPRAMDVKAEYDYIIVGGGTSGLTVADRLTESGERYRDPTLSLRFPSAPQEGLNGRSFGVVHGLMLGGSTGVNAMQVHRGQKEDYNRWGSYFSDNSEWSWDGILPYFKKAWNFHPPPLSWSNSSISKHEVAAFAEIEGVDLPPDSGAGEPGVFWYPLSSDPVTRTRSMARKGHWDGIEAARDNYETITGQRVLRVLFDGETAVGVSFVGANSTTTEGARTVKAKKEVVIATGAIRTPQLLQRSGVGPKSLLEAAGIDVVVDLPGVGQNFQDHPVGAGATFRFTNFNIHPDMTDLENNQTFIDLAQSEFEANRTGPLTIGVGNAASFLPFPVIAPDTFEQITAAYESQDPAAYLPAGTDATVIAGYAVQQKAHAAALRSRGAAFYNLFLRGAPTESNFVLLHPMSRGTIEIDTSNPFFKDPVVDYRALSNPTDIDIQVEFIRFTRKYFLETSLIQFAPEETVPGANVTSFEGLSAAVRAQVSPTTFHPVGTAAMLPRELGGVVDEKLLVYGVKRLSVVDASIQPDLPGAYTQQTVYAVAEKAADLIKSRGRRRCKSAKKL